MRDAVLVDAVRIPIGKRSGAVKNVHPVDLSAHVLTALAGRTGIKPGAIDDVSGAMSPRRASSGGTANATILELL
jgi:acetyl-CoA acyltransferase